MNDFDAFFNVWIAVIVFFFPAPCAFQCSIPHQRQRCCRRIYQKGKINQQKHLYGIGMRIFRFLPDFRYFTDKDFFEVDLLGRNFLFFIVKFQVILVVSTPMSDLNFMAY